MPVKYIPYKRNELNSYYATCPEKPIEKTFIESLCLFPENESARTQEEWITNKKNSNKIKKLNKFHDEFENNSEYWIDGFLTCYELFDKYSSLVAPFTIFDFQYIVQKDIKFYYPRRIFGNESIDSIQSALNAN